MQVVILCGGKGTRLREHTEFVPKPLVEIGGKPILWHVMKVYSHWGLRDFVLCLGYKGEQIKEFFLQRNSWKKQNFVLDLADGTHTLLPRPDPIETEEEDWRIAFVDTGAETNTGGRIKRIQHLIKGPTFLATYSDGVADIDIRDLLAFHRRHGKLATLVGVNVPMPFGVVDVGDDGIITRFREKPRLDHWISGGFFVFERGIFAYLDGDETILERAPFERMAADGQICMYRHSGFWQCMDTYKDTMLLNNLWESGKAAWKVWKG